MKAAQLAAAGLRKAYDSKKIGVRISAGDREARTNTSGRYVSTPEWFVNRNLRKKSLIVPDDVGILLEYSFEYILQERDMGLPRNCHFHYAGIPRSALARVFE